MKEVESLKNWLIEPLSKEEADLVTQGKKYWAGCSLSQNLTGDPKKELDLLKDICRGPAQNGLIDIRAIIFLLFSGPVDTNPYSYSLKGHSAQYLSQELSTREFCAVDIFQALQSKPLNHERDVELTEHILLLAEKTALDASNVPVAIYRSLYVILFELQKETKQRPYVIWQCWSEVFQTLCRKTGFGKIIAFISFLLVYVIYAPEELSHFKMLPDI